MLLSTEMLSDSCMVPVSTLETMTAHATWATRSQQTSLGEEQHGVRCLWLGGKWVSPHRLVSTRHDLLPLSQCSSVNMWFLSLIRSDMSLLYIRALHDPFSSLQLPPEDTVMKVFVIFTVLCHTHAVLHTLVISWCMQDSCWRATRDSVLHQADQVLRQCVSTELKAMKGSTALQVYSLIIDCWLCRELLQWLVSHCTAMQANAVRRQILEELRRENEWTTLRSPTNVDLREILMEKFVADTDVCLDVLYKRQCRTEWFMESNSTTNQWLVSNKAAAIASGRLYQMVKTKFIDTVDPDQLEEEEKKIDWMK